jgi:hypothetical protein
MAPYPIDTALGPWAYLIYLLIGIGFGAVLEMAGFAKSTKLAAQFYFRDLTVLKVMFTAIVTAMVLIFLASAFSLLDYELVWVNPTFLWPGIIGGLIMGVGFIIGGFCPGTSIVALATLKIDGFFFALGTLFGIFVFGETVDVFASFWNSSYYGRLTLPEWLGLPAGVVVLGVVLMALFMFWGGEHLERIFGKKDLSREPKIRYAGAGGLTGLALLVLFAGQPTLEEKWQQMADTKEPLLDQREVQIHPGELLHLVHDTAHPLVMLDVRSEKDYNLFHLKDAKRVEPEQIRNIYRTVLDPQNNPVVVLMSNDERAATQAWKLLAAQKVPNIYILSGGINHWLTLFGKEAAKSVSNDESVGDLRFTFSMALGDRHPASEPDEHALPEGIQYESKVKLAKKIRRQGGCG